MIVGRDELIPPATAEEDSAAAVSPELAERVAAVELQGNFMFDPVRSPCALRVIAEHTTCHCMVLTGCFCNRRRIETFLGPAWERDLSVPKLATSSYRRVADDAPASWQRVHAISRWYYHGIFCAAQGETGAQILVAPPLVPFLEAALTQVQQVLRAALACVECGCSTESSSTLHSKIAARCGQVRTVPVQTRQIGLDKLRVRQAKTDRVNSVEASMRLDAVASAGFRMSRSQLLDVIKAGDIRCDALAGYLLTMGR